MRVLVLLLAMLCACGGLPPTRTGALRAELAQQETELGDVEARAAHLSQTWEDVRLGFLRARDRYADAASRFRSAEQSAAAASNDFAAARSDWEYAAFAWRVYQKLVMIAAAVDARNLDSSRSGRAKGDLNCDEGMGTSAFRAMMTAQGVNLTGIDVDHIVPRSLGGADHPWNYQLVDSSTNRSIGAKWDAEKCAMPGAERCAQAVAASRHCGSFSGPIPF